MKKFFKVPDAKFLMVSQAFKTINRFKTDEQKVFGLTEIMKKSIGLLKIAIARVDGHELTEKRLKVETDTLKLVNKIEKEILKNKGILEDSSKEILQEFLNLHHQYITLLGK